MTSENIKQFVNEYGIFENNYQMLNIENTKNNYDLLFGKREEIYNEIDSINQKTSYLFNYLSFFDINENKMSEILAYLLNPRETHGQGDIYLKQFCPDIEKIKDFNNAEVETEHCTDTYRRIDILVRINGYWLIIENKYREAGDQENQLTDYYMYAKRKLGETNTDKIYIFYLTKDDSNKEPSDFTLKKELKIELGKRLYSMSFSEDICNYLQNCKEISKSHKMKIFMGELIDYIKGDARMDKYYKEEIFKWLSESEKRTKYACEIHDVFFEYVKYLKQSLIDKFQFELKKQVKQKLGEAWLVTQDEDVFEKNKGFNISKHDWKNEYVIALSNDSGNFNGIYYGLCHWHKNDIKIKEKELQTNITKKFGKSKDESDDYFIWWGYVKEGSNLQDSVDNICKLTEEKRDSLIESWNNQLIALATFVEPYIVKLIASNDIGT